MTKSGIHLVAGSGAVGSSLALTLAESGFDVVVATRSGSGPKHPKIKLLSVDMSDFSMLYKTVPNAAAIYNCVNPPYHRWAQEWPVMAQTFLSYAEKTDAVLVTCSNLYGYELRRAGAVGRHSENGGGSAAVGQGQLDHRRSTRGSSRAGASRP